MGIDFRFTVNGEWKEFRLGSWETLRRGDPSKELQICLDEISKPYSHHPCNFGLSLDRAFFTKQALALLVQLLNHPCTSQISSTIEPDTITETTKWNYVRMVSCHLATSLRTLEDKEHYCSPEDMQLFGSTVALRTKELDLVMRTSHATLLHAMCDARELEISTWNIEKPELSALDCARLANVLQRSVRPPPLLHLVLELYHIEDPMVLAEGCVNLKSLSIECGHLRRNTLGDKLLGEGGNSMMQQLLQNPFSQLKDLSLIHVHLGDRNFMAMVELLPTSRLEQLNLKMNDISWRGVMALAHQLPQITCLKTMEIGQSDQDLLGGHHEECCIAMAQGMRDNYSIDSMHMDIIRTQKDRFLYYADCNHAGRRLFVSSYPVPAGLWPRLLERAANRSSSRWGGCQRIERIRRAESIYFLLQNCQALFATSTSAGEELKKE